MICLAANQVLLHQTAGTVHRRCIRISQERRRGLGFPANFRLLCAACRGPSRHQDGSEGPWTSSFRSNPHKLAISGPDTPFSAAQLPAIPCEISPNDCTESFWAFQRFLAICLKILALARRTSLLLRFGECRFPTVLGLSIP